MQPLTPLEQTAAWVSWNMMVFNDKLELIGSYQVVPMHGAPYSPTLVFRALEEWVPQVQEACESVIRTAEHDYQSGMGITRRPNETIENFRRRVYYCYMYHKRYTDIQHARSVPHPLSALMEFKPPFSSP